MKEDVTSYLITFMILIAAGVMGWLIVRLASPNTAATVGGSEANYAQLKQSILQQ